MAETIYSVGTVTVSNGGTTVTGVGTSWQGKIFEGDLFTDPAQGIFARVTADATSNTSISINAWPGTALSGDAYEILLTPDSVRASERTRQLLEQLSVVQANGRGLFFNFSDSVTDADPGSGYIRLNNADPTLATAAYIDVLDANGGAVSGEIDTWDDSTSLGKGNLWVRGIADPSAFHAYELTGSVVDGTGYRKLTLTYIGGSGSFAADDELMVAFARTGDTGEGYVTDATVADPSELTALEGEAAGYLVFVTDLQTDFGAYSGRSGVVRLIAGPDWELVAVYTGPQGVQGIQGIQGIQGGRGINWQGDYNGATAYVEDDGVLYNGSSWRALGDTTGNAPPTLPTTSNAYWQLLARQGIDGAGTVNSVAAGTGIAVDNTDPTAPVVSAPHAVRFNEAQALTAAQKGQARANIGADVLAGLRNKLINGAWSVAQRANSGNIAAGATGWVGDRWQVYNGTNQPLTWSIISVLAYNYAIPPYVENFLNINFAVGPTTGTVELFQRIESVKTLSKGDVSARIYASGPAAFDAYFLLQQRFGSGGSASVVVNGVTTSVNGVSNFVEKKDVLTLAHTGGKTFGVGHDLTFDFVFTPRTAGNYGFTAASLVEGDASAEADPFSPRHVQQEEDICCRYYEKGNGAGNAGVYHFHPYRVRKRVVPSISWTPGGGSNTDLGTYDNGFYVNPTASTGYSYVADAEL
ncbi:hypothetical protein [uncultured Devosia sp.]|uniref:hypothetical protein n=1 Tax=uncultured Devosia sp. TaxID=211434 RepID=UPI00262A1045|nr:hypothetical protein [uncultured Devosia sp.]